MMNSISRVTNENITELKAGEIFVFGSNTIGFHRSGAAKLAVEEFGAVLGKGFGIYGDTFAIPTKDHNIRTLPLETIAAFVDGFRQIVECHPELYFLVTQVGCGLAGLTPEQMAPMFEWAFNVNNVSLPLCFWDVLENAKHDDLVGFCAGYAD